MHKLKLEISKFTVVGALNFCLTFIVFFSLMKISQLPYWVALTFAWGIGVAFTYVLNFVWVFKSDERLEFKKQFIKYFLAYFLSFLLNLLALHYIVVHTGIDPFYIQMALIPFIVVLNFLTSKFWSLRPKKATIEQRKNLLLLKLWHFYRFKLSLLFKHGVSAWIIFVSLSLVAYFVWALDRGFEISDESYYLLLAIHPTEVKLFISAQHWITSAMWSVTGSLIGFRAIGLGSLLFSSLILALGAIHAYTNTFVLHKLRRIEKVIIIASTMSGAMFYGATINFSPCYNLLAAGSSYMALGLTFLTIRRSFDWRLHTLYLLSGCAIGITFLSKATAGMATLGLIVILISICGCTMRERVIGIAQIFLSTIAMVLLITGTHASFSNVFDELKFGILVFKQVQVEPDIVRLMRYKHEIFNQVFWSGVIFVVPVAYVSMFTKSRHITYYTWVAMCCVVLLGCIYLPSAFKTSRWVGAIAFLSSTLAIALVASVPVWTKNAKALALTAGLLILPYCVAFGSGNAIDTQIIDSLAPWGTVIAILAVATKFNMLNRSLVMIFNAVFVYIIANQVILSGYSPYHLNSPLWAQTIPTKIGEIGTVKTDKATNAFVLSLSEAAKKCKISTERPYLGFYGMPGIALILQGIPVYSPWLTNANQSELMLKRVNPELLHSAVIGIQLGEDGTVPDLPRQLQGFPNGYKKCGEATLSNQKLQLWIPD